MRGLRCTVALGMAALFVTAVTVKAEDAPQLKIPAVKVDATNAQKDAEKKMHAAKKEMAGVTNDVKKDADSKIKHAKDQSAEMQKEHMKKAEEMKKEQTKKTEEMKKEAGKGSEKGQAMREEHSKKWLKSEGVTNTVAPTK